jgi:hypothetical protein
MKERPILFQGWKVRKILAMQPGDTMQTRRVVTNGHAIGQLEMGGATSAPCPYGQPGDRLWVRETWRVHPWYDGDAPRNLSACPPADIEYRATPIARSEEPEDGYGRWRPSIHMPRWASRLTLSVTDVRVERVQEISPEDCVAEGVFADGAYVIEPGLPYPVATFKALWDSINAARGYSWDSNPWVWCVTFEVVK